MRSVSDPSGESIPMPASPRPNVAELKAELAGRDYPFVARECIARYASEIGSLEGCPFVDPEDRAVLDEILERSWPEVPADSDRWDADTWQGAPSRWTIAAGLVPPELDAPEPAEHDEADEAFYAAWSDSLPPVTLDLEPFHP